MYKLILVEYRVNQNTNHIKIDGRSEPGLNRPKLIHNVYLLLGRGATQEARSRTPQSRASRWVRCQST